MELSEHYNTQRKKMILPEYGRNIQEMVNFIVKVESRDDRNRMSKAIVNVMANLNPSLRESTEFKIKLWNHLAQMSNYQLDIDYPCKITKLEDLLKKPKPLPYPSNNIRHKHYGGIAKALIQEIATFPESESKDVLLEMLANHMKKLYLVWNKEAVSDEQIYSDINEIAGSDIVKNRVRLNETRDILFKIQKPKQNKPFKKNNHKQR